MATIILERPDTTEETPSNVAAGQDVGAQTPPEAGAEQAVGQAAGSQEAPEPTVKIGGQEVPLSKAEQALKDYGNDQAWKDKNRRESEELNARRKRVERLELLEPMLEQRQDIVQQLFAPKPQRNIDAELAEHYSKRPTDQYDAAQVSAWEMKRDILNSDKIRMETESRIESVRAREEARLHNERVESQAAERYVKPGKVDQDDFQRMTDWIIQNLNLSSGKAPANAYDVAYRALYADRFERDIRADATRRSVAPLRAATSGGADAGLSQRTPPPTATEADDNDFIRSVKDMSKGQYTKL